MAILCFGRKLSMDINQIMELWRSLSPRLAKAIPGEEPPRDERAERRNSDEDRQDKIVDPVENHQEEDDV